MRRTLREKVVLRRKGNADSESDTSVNLDDVPEISDADVRIAEYAAAASAKEGEQEVAHKSRPGPGFPDLARLRGVGCGNFVPLAADVPEGNRCNDGCVSFVVPRGWVATRMADCFGLFSDLAVGFVRTTKANEAAQALLQTDRLQVVAEVSAVSSPVFVTDNEIQVDYSSHAGAGKGYVGVLETPSTYGGEKLMLTDPCYYSLSTPHSALLCLSPQNCQVCRRVRLGRMRVCSLRSNVRLIVSRSKTGGFHWAARTDEHRDVTGF